MTNDTMLEPTTDFIRGEFEHVHFGAVRPSEMELLLFYVLAYYGGDLNKSVFELANKYYITEAKASRMLVEISKRYRKPGLGSNAPVIRDIAARVFAGGGTYRQNITVTGETVSFVIPDPVEYRAMREELEKCRIANLYTGAGRNFRLTKADFLCFFSKYYDEVASKIRENLRDQHVQDKDYKAMFEKSQPVTERIRDLILSKADKILSSLQLITDFAENPA